MNKQQLNKEIKTANLAYTSGMPYMTDEEYDILWQQLYSIDPKNPNLYHTAKHTNKSNNIKTHFYPIKGTQKAFCQDDLKPFLERFGSKELTLEPKYDGCAAVLYRQPNNTYQLLLEGNGLEGRDVTKHLKNITLSWEPQSIESIEIIIPMENWKSSYGANPRNTIAGWLNRHQFPNQSICSMISHTHGKLRKNIFYDGNLENFSETLLILHTLWKKLYPIDGIMIKVKDKKLRLISDTDSQVYNWSLAWKPPIQTASTIVRDIEWNVSRQGKIVPTVIYDKIELCGTMNKRVTGNNYKWIEDKGINIGSEIIVGKAGEIIPKILSSNKQGRSNIPYTCPICNSYLATDGVHLICEAENCIAKISKSINYFYSMDGLDLKSIGEAKIIDLLKNMDLYKLLVKSPWALLDPDTYNITNTIRKILGDPHTDAYLKQLREINNTKNVCHFISALGKPKLGYKTAIKLYYLWKGVENNTNIAKKAVTEFVDSLLLSFKVFDELQNFKFIPVSDKPAFIYCITGKLSCSRNDMVNYLNKYNWLYAKAISAKTAFLIVGEKPGTYKIRMSEERNVKQITEDEIINYIKKGD
jgi:DNA ligase (NAD+)